MMRVMGEPRVIEIPDPALVVLVGAAGAGKTTFAARHFAADEVLSSDGLREAISGDAADQRATGPAFAALHRALTRRLHAGRLTVVDATNVTPTARGALLRRAAAAGVPAFAIVLDMPPALVIARNASRPAIGPRGCGPRHRRPDRSLQPGPDTEALRVVRLTDPAEVDGVRQRGWSARRRSASSSLRRPNASPSSTQRRSACRRPRGRSRGPGPRIRPHEQDRRRHVGERPDLHEDARALSSAAQARCLARNGIRVSAPSGVYVAWTSQTVSIEWAGVVIGSVIGTA
jgi:predicted kinase